MFPSLRMISLTPPANPVRSDGCITADECIAQAYAHPLRAVLAACVQTPVQVTGPARDVGTSGLAVYGLVLTLQGRRGLGWCDEENSGDHEDDREEKLAGHDQELRCCKT
jgi:hypothetical protein